MSSSDRTGSYRTANAGSTSSHASTNANANAKQQQQQPAAPPLSDSFYNNSNNPLANISNIKVQNVQNTKPNILRMAAVRERSKAIPGIKELKNKDPYSTTISFLVMPITIIHADGLQDDESKSDTTEHVNKLPIRVSVFCDTGTIGTAAVIDGKVRQTFRRNVTSLDVVERLLRHPEGPVVINDQLIGVTEDEDEQQQQQQQENTNVDANGNKFPNFKRGVELADVGLCILEGKREELAKHLRHLEDEAETQAAAAKAAVQEALQQEQLKKQEAAKQKQAQQQQQQAQQAQQQQAQVQAQQQPTKPQAQAQQTPPETGKHPSGEKQSQILHKAISTSTSSSTTAQKGSSGNSSRIGRRRNKLNNLRKNRSLNNSKSGLEMNKTKRRGGKQPSSSSSNAAASESTPSAPSKPKQRSRSGRMPTKTQMTTITANPGGATTSNTASNFDGNDSDSNASMLSSSEYNKKVTTNNNNPNTINSFKNCGFEFHFKLPAEVMNQVDQCLRDIAKMNKVVKGVATNGRGTVFLYGNGGVAYTPAIPKALYQKLRQLRSSSFSSRPCFVALGTRDRYYVSFNDGSGDWKGSSSMDKMLKKRVSKSSSGSSSKRPSLSGDRNSTGSGTDNAPMVIPRSVAFGSTYDTFFIVFGDGTWEYQGRSIPKSLEKKLRERDDAADLVICNLGPNGEWFLKAESGKMWWSGITPELDLVLKKITKKGYLHNMDFGENGSYFVSYDDE